ncbi:unnamed protein product, partial [Symbiodinium pilosum]
YTGSIENATCSRQEDDLRIRREIGTKVPDVDYAIEVLMSAGMSTPALRGIALKGVSIRQAANPEIALPMLLLGSFTVLTSTQLVLNTIFPSKAREHPAWMVTTIAERMLTLLQLLRQP